MMNTLWLRRVLLLLCFVLPISQVSADSPIPDEKLAISAALSFLELADQGEYEQCWNSSSELFRNNVVKQAWLQDISHTRPQYGETRHRALQYIKPVSQAGDFNAQPTLFLIFRSTFSLKTIAEMVTVSKDSDNLWRVAGYSIQ